MGIDQASMDMSIENENAESTMRSFSNEIPAQLGILSSLCSAAAMSTSSEYSFEHDKSASLNNQPESNATRKLLPSERLQRSRERNRMHARKTRQRKKEHMAKLQSRADYLKKEQVRIRQIINEKTTASILVGLFSTSGSNGSTDSEDPKIEELLQRSVESIPDVSKIPELPALILPGQHNSRKQRMTTSTDSDGAEPNGPQHSTPEDGIDYKLLGKDRSKCTPAELDQIRRERNRMHAKRTRDRKRLFMEEMEEVIKKLEGENALLKNHLDELGGDPSLSAVGSPPPLVSPKITPADSPQCKIPEKMQLGSKNMIGKQLQRENPQLKQQFVTQLKSLLVAAGVFEENGTDKGITAKSSIATATTAVSSTNISPNSSVCEELSAARAIKRQRLETSIPHSITTSSTAS
eukprot:CAMPEP_0194232874 /NCGR_PEP_ID=MMETSP0158-20130606/1064_1 /TAXON_ID=33649 /ORGANISM="Thalassionema nitzschioides, Strain L26-B" /LENGTH=407 /DNA_ID=CAMNT_0038965691 /DNA_START=279 /DNA_END=1502 /DNA_ORIENTATION=+